jgi:hypothetical protein
MRRAIWSVELVASIRRSAIALGLVVLVSPAGSPAAEARREFRYGSLCDASAGIALDREHFVVADDEHDELFIFETGHRKPVGTVDLHAFLGSRRRAEADLEGAARIDDRIYWISSHGRNSKGEVEPTRYRFFATDIVAGSPPSLREVPSPYPNLLADLVKEPKLAKYKLSWAETFAPEEPGGLNIEGLAATKDRSLLVGFRNPVRRGKALLVPLENPADVLSGEKARFGEPIDLDLGGRGIRSIERIGETFWIVAGQTGDKKKCDKDAFALYRWSGQKDEAAKRVKDIDLDDLSPEALFVWPNGKLQILSDDGELSIDGKECKDLDEDERGFRSIVVEP